MLVLAGHTVYRCLPWDQKAILAVDECASHLHGDLSHLVEHSLGSFARRDRTLDVPNVRVLGRHVRTIETRMEHLFQQQQQVPS